MTYEEAIQQLNALTPELHVKEGEPRRKFSLDEVRLLLAALGDPHRRFRSVLIAGTNGKGSAAATLASILSVSGLKTGLYTSPHLERPNERIKIRREEIGNDDFARLFTQVVDTAQRLVAEGKLEHAPSFFETLTAMAFLYYAEAGVDFAVLEVGMGGRLDATNVVDPLLSIITDISLDHTEWLGSTLAEIAGEKAGVLRAGGTLIKLPQNAEVDQALDEKVRELNAVVMDASVYLPKQTPEGPFPVELFGLTTKIGTPLDGEHQHRNVALAVAAAVELASRHGLPITNTTIQSGVRWTYWPARFEKLAAFHVEWILDVAHNPAGVRALLDRLMKQGRRERTPRVLLFSCLADKPLMEMAKILFPFFEFIVFAPISNPRAAKIEDLERAALELQIPYVSAKSIGEAVRLAGERAVYGPVVAAGSVYLVGAVRPILVSEQLP